MVKSYNQGRWTQQEHLSFLTGIKLNLKWDQIAEIVGTRNSDQCRSHHQKFKQRRSTSPFCRTALVDKSTQYEPPITFFSYQPVFLMDSGENLGSYKESLSVFDTMSSESEFKIESFEYDDFLI